MRILTKPSLSSTDTEELFKYIIQHLASQGRPSTGKLDDGVLRCMYFGDEGRRCPIGLFIPNDQYVFWKEGDDLTHSLAEQFLMSSKTGIRPDNDLLYFLSRNGELFCFFQHFHDNYDVWKSKTSFKDHARKLARKLYSRNKIEWIDYLEVVEFIDHPDFAVNIPRS